MICPTCGWDNLPGNEACAHCQQDLTSLDRPFAGSRVERSLMEVHVRDLKFQDPTTVTPQTSIAEAMTLMLDRNIGAVLVVDEQDKLLGIFSERDLLKKVAGIHDVYAHRPVSDFMTPRPASVTMEDTLVFVLHRMDGGNYRHIPILSDHKPVGVVSVRDMLRYITSLCQDA